MCPLPLAQGLKNGDNMWLVLCHTNDLNALWAYQGLQARGLVPLELVSAESLSFSLQWEHRIDTESVSFRITLADGRQVSSERIFGALNRIQFVPLPHWRRASVPDQEYVQQEMAAFYTSWLFALPGPVLNPATSSSLSGAWRTPMEWMKLASQAGLGVPVCHNGQVLAPGLTRRETVLVVHEQVIGDGIPVAHGCQRLAEISRTPLLGIDFEVTPDGSWYFAGASPTPDLTRGGAQFLDALKSCLEKGLS